MKGRVEILHNYKNISMKIWNKGEKNYEKSQLNITYAQLCIA